MAGPGRFGGPAGCAACGCDIHRIDRNVEASEVSRVIKRVSCAGVAMAVLCGLVACASSPPKSDAQLQADKVMGERVEAALNADKALFAKHITAHADNGVVRLTGYVWETSDFQEAVSIAEGVPGVTRVVNDLELNRNGNENGPVAR
jgi:BON domain